VFLLFLVHCDRPFVDPVYEVILALVRNVRNGSRLCENSEIQIACRNSISVSLISEINCTDSSCRDKAVENIFLRLLGFRTFSHSLGQKRTWTCADARSALPPMNGHQTARTPRPLLPTSYITRSPRLRSRVAYRESLHPAPELS
jgi:hypothetical protein